MRSFELRRERDRAACVDGKHGFLGRRIHSRRVECRLIDCRWQNGVRIDRDESVAGRLGRLDGFWGVVHTQGLIRRSGLFLATDK